MTDKAAGSAVDRLGNINSLLLGVGDQKCLDYKYSKMIDSYRNNSWDNSAGEGGI